jgi:hypothetical protein
MPRREAATAAQQDARLEAARTPGDDALTTRLIAANRQCIALSWAGDARVSAYLLGNLGAVSAA